MALTENEFFTGIITGIEVLKLVVPILNGKSNEMLNISPYFVCLRLLFDRLQQFLEFRPQQIVDLSFRRVFPFVIALQTFVNLEK